MANTLEATFGLNLAPLKRGFAEAATIAKTGASRVAAEMKRAMTPADMAARSRPMLMPNQRFSGPERGFKTGADFPPAPAGKYPDPEEEAAGKGGRALFHSFRSLAVTAVFGQAINVITEAIVKANDFRLKLVDITKVSGSGAFRGFSEIEQSLQGASAALDEIRQKQMWDKTGNFVNRWSAAVRKLITGESDAEDEASKKRLRETISKDIEDQAQKQGLLNEAEQESLSGSEKRSELLKEEATHRERLGKLAAQAAETGTRNNAALYEENDRTELVNTKIREKFKLQERALQVAGEEASMELRGVATLDLKIAKLQNVVRSIQAQSGVNENITDQRRAQLVVDEAGAKAAAIAAASGRPVLSHLDIHERAKLGLGDIAQFTPQESLSGSALGRYQELNERKLAADRMGNDLDAERFAGAQAKLFGPGSIARQAQRDERLSNMASLRGDLPLAESFMGLSDKLRESIPQLKSSEKPTTAGPSMTKEDFDAVMAKYWGG